MPSSPRRHSRWLAPAMLLLGGASLVLVWVFLALYLQRQLGWMALLAATDAVLVLRWCGVARGAGRSVLAVLATLAICTSALWGIAATQLGLALGLVPWDSALKLGAHHAWTLTSLATTPYDWAALLLSLPLAAWWAR